MGFLKKKKEKKLDYILGDTIVVSCASSPYVEKFFIVGSYLAVTTPFYYYLSRENGDLRNNIFGSSPTELWRTSRMLLVEKHILHKHF